MWCSASNELILKDLAILRPFRDELRFERFCLPAGQAGLRCKSVWEVQMLICDLLNNQVSSQVSSAECPTDRWSKLPAVIVEHHIGAVGVLPQGYNWLALCPSGTG
jgi:hypothetical protein